MEVDQNDSLAYGWIRVSACSDAGRAVDIHEIRRSNLRFLVEEYADGNLTTFVEVTLRDSMSYKVLQRVVSSGARRNLGSALARRIEAQLRLERGWMDHDRSGTAHTETAFGGYSGRVLRLAELIESLSPSVRRLLEKLVKALAKR